MPTRKRVILAGLFHETHTFLEGTTALDAFQIREDDSLLSSRGDGSPLAGAIEVADAEGWELIPAVDLRATPSAIVEDAVFAAFWTGLSRTLDREASTGVDGIFLVLHGAMVCQSHRDVEGELIARIRAVPGLNDIPICGVLDLHGNISRSNIERAQGFVAYRTNPHIDAHRAAVDAAGLLDRILTTGKTPTCVWRQAPVVWPPTGTGTDDEPMRTLEAMAREIERENPEIATVNVMAGFSFGDTHDTGVSFSATTFGDRARASRELDRLGEWTIEHQAQGNVVEAPLVDVLPRILENCRRGQTPVAVVEPADNIGGGAPGDSTTLLRAFLDHRLPGAAVIINDPEAVNRMAGARPGEIRTLQVGGKGSRLTDPPVEVAAEFVSSSDGRFELEDRNSHLASMSGIHVDMGRCVVVQSGGVTILLTSRKTPPFDLGQWRSQGIDPQRLTAIGVKAAVAHRRAYDPIVKASYTVSTPGPCTSDLRQLPYSHVRRPVFPLDER